MITKNQTPHKVLDEHKLPQSTLHISSSTIVDGSCYGQYGQSLENLDHKKYDYSNLIAHQPQAMAFRRYRNTQVIAFDNNKLREIDIKTGRLINQYQVPMRNSAIASLVMTANSQKLFACNFNGSIILLCLRTGKIIKQFNNIRRGYSQTRIFAYKITPDGKSLIYVGDRSLGSVKISTQQVDHWVIDTYTYTREFLLTSDNKKMIIGGQDCTIKIFSIPERSLLKVQGKICPNGIVGMEFLDNETKQCIVSGAGDVIIASSQTGLIFRQLENPSERITAMVITNEGILITANGWNGTLRKWCTRSLEVLERTRNIDVNITKMILV